MKVCPAKVYSRYLGNIQPKLANMCSDDCTYYEIGNNGVWPCINFKKLKAKKEKTDFLVTVHFSRFNSMWLRQISQYPKISSMKAGFAKENISTNRPRQKSIANEIHTEIHTKQSLIYRNLELLEWRYYNIQAFLSLFGRVAWWLATCPRKPKVPGSSPAASYVQR